MANRAHGIIDGLNPALRSTVEQMLLSGKSTYADVIDYLARHDVAISAASVCRYAQRYNANAALLNVAQENFSRMMQEMDKYPDLDTTEAIIRLASQNVFAALANTNEDQWNNLDKDKLLDSALGLARAASYKKRTDAAVRAEADVGLDAVKSIVFQAMSKERPELYKQVASFLSEKKRDGSLRPKKEKSP
ncbi:phage protein Gp27 family protein [Ethanoligenens harbinense]|uniref:DUF3486 domain-containing protein n=1 Tax=Ethanoligenens harbinense (strain DSM 18485 / JCM 12961 / CGMCC 1.5033 / YUAN-3) TaxID=663278 RepID=E6U924_ETHHY|nr:phage protein Gp27 family protein [Ethanoligenens harbinense]ADU26088.1 hypothetical protein Ethha_0503 [Ethanoligenens harbinense YUAN-3]AVQ95231.1 DUF3486 domain-containing protein [Ethanoligenens harbinense YUAN-3]AYF37922.1 DUF3486 domain-containing protein [Ethanoligenens harbinense]AYF40642.1 DUF3486 domain-containing protein [Ethanoligenens harbinense]QCN91476.1 DUF3486 family protein [Ethanoligenens harbinense]